MSHPSIENLTPFAFQPLFVADEDGRPVLSPIVKATFDVDLAGGVTLAEEQAPVDFEGEYHGEPGMSSTKTEPETAFTKPGTDLVLLGHAHAPQVGAVWTDVQFAVGQTAKTVRVFGDRFVTGGLTAGISAPAPFERIPLVYERAFGGWDRTPADENDHEFDAFNPVGVGFKAKRGVLLEGAPIPNLEDPFNPIQSPNGRVTPAGFGFISPDWMPRSALAGTYDEAWSQQRAPLLPLDFDRRFFNAASPGLVVAGHLQGNEGVHVRGATPEGQWAFWLPGIAPPVCRVETRNGPDADVATQLDTVIVDGDERRLTLIWRGSTTLQQGPPDVRSMRVASAHVPEILQVDRSAS